MEEGNITGLIPKWRENKETGKIEEAFQYNAILPIKGEGETILWYRKKEEGLINKTLRAYEVLTEYRCYFYDLKTHIFINCPLFYALDVVVTNQKRISESQRSGSFIGTGASGTFVGSSGGFSTGESQTFGDVNILDEGEIVFTYFSVADPNGLAKLIKYLIKKEQDLVERIEKQVKNLEKLKNTELECIKCQTPNPCDSKFCNKCGQKFTTVCTQCKNVNPSDSSFCNKCGFTLQ
jgi:ribosomal protein L40E